MNKKRTLISASILLSAFTISQASDFVIVVSKNNNDYYIYGQANEEATEWGDVNVPYNCVARYDDADYNLGLAFTQIEDCKQDQTRTVTLTELIDGVEKKTTTVENKTVDIEVSYQDIGTKNYITGNRTDQSEWIDDGSTYDCNTWLPAVTDIYNGTDFTQNRTCSQDQDSVSTSYDEWADGSETVTNTVNNEQTITVAETKDMTGTRIANSCKEVLNSQGSHGSDYYPIQVGGSTQNLFCDMDTDGGGWTIVADQNLYREGYPTANAGIPNIDPNNAKNTRLTRWPKYSEYAIKSYVDLHGAPYDDSVQQEFRKFNTGSFGEVEVDIIGFHLNRSDFQSGRASNAYITHNGVAWGDSNSHDHYTGVYWFGKNGMTYNHWGQEDVWGHVANSNLFIITSLHKEEGYGMSGSCGAAWASNGCREAKTVWTHRNTVKQKVVFMVR